MNKKPRQKLINEVIEGILLLIENKKLAIGDQLPSENVLIEMFNVSRTSVREAVKSLTAIGVLQIRHGTGTFVKTPRPGPLLSFQSFDGIFNRTELIELLECRRIFEIEVAALAAMRATSNDINELERCVKELAKGVAKGIRPPEDLGFHLALAKSTKNKALVDVSNLIVRFYEKDLQMPDKIDVTRHNQIYEAVKNQNPEAARVAMRIHLDELERRYKINDSTKQ